MTQENGSEQSNGNGITIPKWFVMLVSGGTTLLLLTLLPWGVWATATLITINVKMDRASEMESKIEKLRDEDVIHVRRMDLIEGRLSNIERTSDRAKGNQ